MLFLCKTLRLLSSVQYQRVINCFLVQDLFGRIVHEIQILDYKDSLLSTPSMDCIRVFRDIAFTICDDSFSSVRMWQTKAYLVYMLLRPNHINIEWWFLFLVFQPHGKLKDFVAYKVARFLPASFSFNLFIALISLVRSRDFSSIAFQWYRCFPLSLSLLPYP